MKINKIFKISSENDVQNARLDGSYWNNLKASLLQLYGKDLFICVTKPNYFGGHRHIEFSVCFYTKQINEAIKLNLTNEQVKIKFYSDEVVKGYALIYVWFKINGCSFDQISNIEFYTLRDKQVKEDNNTPLEELVGVNTDTTNMSPLEEESYVICSQRKISELEVKNKELENSLAMKETQLRAAAVRLSQIYTEEIQKTIIGKPSPVITREEQLENTVIDQCETILRLSKELSIKSVKIGFEKVNECKPFNTLDLLSRVNQLEKNYAVLKAVVDKLVY